MGGQRWRVWFGERAATLDELNGIEEIEVIQEMDAFWEARLRMVLCLDPRGTWLHWPGDSSKPFSRVRIEIDIGSGSFAPLIDGPLVSIDAGLDAQPGRSTATMVVRDDSAFLNRDEGTEPPFEQVSASDIARDIFGRFKQIADKQVKDTGAALPSVTRRGTVLQFLRELGRASDRHAYVLPGPKPGKSIGCFLPDPKGPNGLPPLVLIGEGRNLANASVVQDPCGGEITVGRVLRAGDLEVTEFETSAADLGLIGSLPALPADLTPRRLLHPADNPVEDPAAAATAQARRNGYVYWLSSHVVPGCYDTVLVPYQKVRLDAGAAPYSGNYLITRVVHRITPSTYTQELQAKADALTKVSKSTTAGAAAGAPEGIL
jgi:hypothetical protein